MNIVIFNVKYSDNLGDGLLATCLEMALANEGSNTRVETVDIAGRTAYGTTHGRRTGAIKLLHYLPRFARRMVVSAILARKLKGLRRSFEQALSSADAAVIGGGNLFQDDDLNFPLKMGLVLDCVARSGKPLLIHAVGVSERWSRRARKLFGHIAETNIVSVSVRDERSRRNWERHFPDGPKPLVRADPGLLACELRRWDEHRSQDNAADTFGVCVTSPIILQRHANIPAPAIPLRTVEEYVALVRRANEAGYRVLLFSNGAREDQAFAELVAAHPDLSISFKSGVVVAAERPCRPEDLLLVLRSASVVVAHRLHACIASYSLGIPCIGLDWDLKVSSFFHSVGDERYCLSGPSVTPAQIFHAAVDARTEGVNQDVHSSTITKARLDIAMMSNTAERIVGDQK
jgi:polysaccharide pyruvyl transferase WcaK-like protein